MVVMLIIVVSWKLALKTNKQKLDLNRANNSNSWKVLRKVFCCLFTQQKPESEIICDLNGLKTNSF